LQDEGFDVLGTTNINDGVSIFTSLGVRAEGTHFDMAEFIRTDEKMEKAMKYGNAIQFGIAVGGALVQHFPKEFSSQWEVARNFQPDLIVACTLTFLQASSIGQALRVPVVHADLGIFSFLPISKHTTTELHEPKCLHKAASFFCVVSMLVGLNQKNKDMVSLYGTMRKELFSPVATGGGGLPESERLLGQDGGGQFAREWMNPMAPNLFAVSDSVLPKATFDDLPPIFSERSHWTGNWYVSKSLEEELAQKGDPNFSNSNNNNAPSEDGKKQQNDTQKTILDFLDVQKDLREAAGQQMIAPAYIGWGSMMAVSPEHMTRLAVQSLMLAGLPGIVLGGFANLHIGLLKGEKDKDIYDYATKNVLFLQSAPHGWLFPHCSVTVHHGGAGTTSAALRSGVPTVVTPCLADQFDNAALVRAAGCGVGFKKALLKITVLQLAEAMKLCVQSVDEGGKKDVVLSSCQRVAEALEKEDGVKNAVREIDTFLKTRVDSGQWKEEFEQRLEQRSKAPWSLSHAVYRMMFYKEPFVEE
jgi:hypothetical protein